MDKIIILDFGAQYTQLIARRIRELDVYCETITFNKKIALSDKGVRGIILSGGPASVKDKNAPRINLHEMNGSIPVLGICYGAQLLAQELGGEVTASRNREFGRANICNLKQSLLLHGVHENSQVWMSHSDTIVKVPDSAEVIASTDSIPVAAFQLKDKKFFGVQFHPEVVHTKEGFLILRNFVYDVCKCKPEWTPAAFVDSAIKEIRDEVGKEKIICGLSGGVDSTVTATLIHRAIGKQQTCIFVNNGLLRKNEYESVKKQYKKIGLNLDAVDAEKKFLSELKKIIDPEKKRKIIGRVFIEVFEKEAKKIKGVKFLAQGTIYPDRIESAPVKGPSATIKSHHNVGGLPEKMKLKVIEPLRYLFKDEVRKVGRALGIENEILERHPFPGPGLAVRVIGEITKQRLDVLREADAIFIDALKKNNLYDSVWQAFAVFLPVSTVGVMGDERTYENVIALRAVTSTDGMTADWAQLPQDFLADVSNTIINKVQGVNRVVYDISSKPPATIEWE